MNTYAPTPRTKVRRRPQRAVYDKATVHSILDEGVICHVGFALEGQPYVIPTLYARDGERLYLHGSAVSRMLKTLGEGVDVCVTVTLVDAYVLARSAFHHSMNYRSVVVLGTAHEIVERDAKLAALQAVLEHALPGRGEETRWPNAKELAATRVIALPIEEASAKQRSGGPLPEEEDDPGLRCWAGELPIRTGYGLPITARDVP